MTRIRSAFPRFGTLPGSDADRIPDRRSDAAGDEERGAGEQAAAS